MSYLSKWWSKNKTPQSAPIPGTSQVPNSAGGFAFAVDDWARLDRFLILGAEGGSYYATERQLTRDNAQAVLRCLQLDGRRVVNRIVAVSDEGRAPKNDPALFALALAAKLGDVETRRAAFAALPRVARIGTHLFHFAEYVKALGGWGRGTMRAFAALVHGDGGEPPRAPGGQVPEPRRLVAPRPAAQGAPGRQGRSPASDLPLDDQGLGCGRRLAAPRPGAGDDLGVRAGEELARAS